MSEVIVPPLPVTPDRVRLGGDYADWISPMLVKELRQRLRSRSFVILFSLLHAMMILCVLTGVGLSAIGVGSDGNRVFFWFMLFLPIGVFTPIFGLHGFGDELKNQGLEAIILTPLKARQIVFGKWLGLMSVALLLTTSVLPYLVTRYFLGGVDLLGE